MRSRQYRAIEVGKDAVVTLQPAGFGLRSSFHRSHVLQRSGGDVLITWRDSLPASHDGRAIRRSPAGPLDLTRCAQVEAASSSLPAAFQKENTILTDGVSFWSGRRGSNSLPRPWQGRALPDELRPQMVPPVGVEPTTRGFSVRCSTN